jgi:hypothetical protein
MGMPPIKVRHRKRLGKELLSAVLVRAYHVARLQYQRSVMAKPLRTLYLAQTVAVYCRRRLSAAGTYYTLAGCMCIKGLTLAVQWRHL